MNQGERAEGGEWLSTLNESRDNCRYQIAEAEAAVSDPHRAVWPRRSVANMGPTQRKVTKAHIAVFDYADVIRVHNGHSNEVADLWEEKLMTVAVGDGFGDLPVSLENLDEKWEHMLIKQSTTTEDELHGTREVPEIKRLILPVKAARVCYRQLNQITQKLGFAGDPKRNTPVFGPIDETIETGTTEG